MKLSLSEDVTHYCIEMEISPSSDTAHIVYIALYYVFAHRPMLI